MQQVKFRYLGKGFLKGHPKRERIIIEGAKFWNCRRFSEQLSDLSYLRSIEFYERNKALLDNRQLFITEIVEEVEQPILTEPETKSESEPNPEPEFNPVISTRTPEFTEFGVTETDGKLQCPKCHYSIVQTKKMQEHIKLIHER